MEYLCCPQCEGDIELVDGAVGGTGEIADGKLSCRRCDLSYPIVGGVPRFVPDEGYAEGFGVEWNAHRLTQYDQHSGVALTEARFFTETGWPRRLEGEVVLEAGSGSGRFTEQALSTGALVLSLDYSRAVDANFASNGHHPNLLLVQGDLFNMPFPVDVADRLFCLGVLQHTPDPRRALQSLTSRVKPGGQLAADIYAKTFARYVLGTKYWVRPLTRRIPPGRLYKMTSRYVDTMWPIARQVRRVRGLGKAVNWRLLIGDYSHLLQDDEMLRDWAKLDTFDMLAPRYDKPARASTVRRWCAEIGLESVTVERGFNGYEIRGRRPSLR